MDKITNFWLHHMSSTHQLMTISENQNLQKEREILGVCQRKKKAAEYESDGDTSCKWCTWNGPQSFGKGTGRTGNQKKNRDRPNIVEIG